MKKGVHFSFIHRHIGPILFFIAFLIALLSFDEYGLGWDEPQQRGTGKVCYDYVFSEDSNLLRWSDRDYGVAFELPLIILEKTFNLTDSRSIYLMRHLVTHLFFLLGCYFLFRLIDYLYNNKLLSTIGFLLLVLHPRLYSHSFFNTKDIPFMTMFIISIYYSVKALDKKTVLSFIKSGISDSGDVFIVSNFSNIAQFNNQTITSFFTSDVFLVKASKNGNWDYVKRLGSSGGLSVNDVLCKDENVILGGTFGNTIFIDSVFLMIPRPPRSTLVGSVRCV